MSAPGGGKERMDWMYKANAFEPSKEDYLLGKEFREQRTQNELDLLEERKVAGSKLVAAAAPKAPRVDTFSMRVEDPLFMIKQREKQAHDQLMNNPLIQ